MNTQFTFLNQKNLIDNELKLTVIEKVPANSEKNYVPAYKFEMINSETGEKMGKIDLRIGNNDNIKYGGHIGYRVEEKFRGHHYAARSVKLILPLAKQHGLDIIYITCAPENIASKRTCEIAGGEFIEIIKLPEDNEMYQRGDREKCLYKFKL